MHEHIQRMSAFTLLIMNENSTSYQIYLHHRHHHQPHHLRDYHLMMLLHPKQVRAIYKKNNLDFSAKKKRAKAVFFHLLVID